MLQGVIALLALRAGNNLAPSLGEVAGIKSCRERKKVDEQEMKGDNFQVLLQHLIFFRKEEQELEWEEEEEDKKEE